MSGDFNPYHQWLGIPKKNCPPTYYELLRISVDEQDRKVICMAVERQKEHMEQFHVGKQAKLAAKIVYELEEAELTLLNPDLRREYDKRMGLTKKQRSRRQANSMSAPNGSNETVGEDSGLLRQYSGIVTVLAISFIIMAASVYLLPWQKIVFDKSSDKPQGAGQQKLEANVAKNAVESKKETGPANSNRPSLLVAPFSKQQAETKQQEWASYLKQNILETNSLGMKFIIIPPGEFMMGDTEEEVIQAVELMTENVGEPSDSHKARMNSSKPQHEVVISKPFLMGTHELTQNLFRQFVEETNYQTDAEKDGKGGYGFLQGKQVQAPQFLWNTNYGVDQPEVAPVINVSWNDATEFCKWLSTKEGKRYRLPTEAEWEYACRAGTTTMFSFGEELALVKEHAWFTENSLNVDEKYPHPVMTKKPNPFGLFDMHGNVYEWCQDWYDESYYTTLAGKKTVDPEGPITKRANRVLRGGCWQRWSMDLKSSYRDRISPLNRNLNVGFRIVCELE